MIQFLFQNKDSSSKPLLIKKPQIDIVSKNFGEGPFISFTNFFWITIVRKMFVSIAHNKERKHLKAKQTLKYFALLCFKSHLIVDRQNL